MATQDQGWRDAVGHHVLRIPPQNRHLKIRLLVAPGVEKVVDVPPQPGTLTVTVAPNVNDPDIWKNEDGGELLVYSPQSERGGMSRNN